MSKEIEPIRFKEVNIIYVADGCGNLPARNENGQITSCWKVPFCKRIKLLFTGKIWLGIMGFKPPPVYLETDNPFKS